MTRSESPIRVGTLACMLVPSDPQETWQAEQMMHNTHPSTARTHGRTNTNTHAHTRAHLLLRRQRPRHRRGRAHIPRRPVGAVRRHCARRVRVRTHARTRDGELAKPRGGGRVQGGLRRCAGISRDDAHTRREATGSMVMTRKIQIEMIQSERPDKKKSSRL